jgi:hypothetical protein
VSQAASCKHGISYQLRVPHSPAQKVVQDSCISYTLTYIAALAINSFMPTSSKSVLVLMGLENLGVVVQCIARHR